MSRSFEINLQQHLEADPEISRRGARILAVLKGRKGRRRTRIIERMERHTAVQLSIDGERSIDWSTIDWSKLLETILKLLMALLPLLI